MKLYKNVCGNIWPSQLNSIQVYFNIDLIRSDIDLRIVYGQGHDKPLSQGKYDNVQIKLLCKKYSPWKST